MKNKKQLIGIVLALIILIVAVIVTLIFITNRPPQDPATTATEETVKPKKRLTAPQNLLPLEKRPVVTLKPFTQNGGRFVSIVISQVRETATLAEYEIVYNVIGTSAVSAAGAKIKVPEAEQEGGLQAFTGELDLTNLPTKTENRFGTCSAGGACINNSISGGIITLNFAATEKYGVNGNWTYFENGNAISAMTDPQNESSDSPFKIEAAGLAQAKDYLIMEALGLPDGVPAPVVMIPDSGKDGGTKPAAYQINFTNPPAITQAAVSFTTQTPDQQIAVYDGDSWSVIDDPQIAPFGDGYYYVLLTSTSPNN